MGLGSVFFGEKPDDVEVSVAEPTPAEREWVLYRLPMNISRMIPRLMATLTSQ